MSRPCALSLAMIVFVLAGCNGSGDSGAGETLENIGERLKGIERQIASLELGIQNLGKRMSDLGPRPRGAGTVAKEDVLDAVVDSAENPILTAVELLADKLDRLENRLEDGEVRLMPTQLLKQAGLHVLSDEETTEWISGSTEAAVDRSLGVKERVQALERLRQYSGGRTKEVALAMIELIQDSSIDSLMRAHVIRNLHGLTFEELKQPLLHALLNDPDPEVRSESVETLEEYLGDPTVMEAMVHVQENDESIEVQAEARLRIESWKIGSR